MFLTLLPTLILNSKKEDKPLTTRDYAGWTLWAIGFLFEAIADHQKSRFRANPDNTVRHTLGAAYNEFKCAKILKENCSK